MSFSHRQLLSVAAVISISAGALLYSMPEDFESDPVDRAIDLALVQEMLRSRQQTSVYRLIPESVMTGLCWRTDGNSREGVFKDVNAGIAHWRDQAPMAASRATQYSSTGPSSLADDVHRLLSRQLERLSFEATDYRFNAGSAEITGELAVGDYRRELVLNITVPAKQNGKPAPDIIELNATTELAASDLGNGLKDVIDQPLNLCITMQAVKESVLPDSPADKPLMLSHYYR